MGSKPKAPRASLAGAIHKEELRLFDRPYPSHLEAVVKELASKLHRLEVENKSLAVKREILFGTWLATRQAAYFLSTARSSVFLGQQRASSEDSVQGLEGLLLASLGGPSGVPSDPLEAWVPWKATPGISRQLLSSFIDLSLVHGKAHASLLGSRVPSSLLVGPLLTLCYDPAASEHVIHGTGRAAVGKATEQLRSLLQQAASAQQGSSMRAHLMRDVAVTLLLAARVEILGELILQPDHHLNEHIFMPGEQYLPPDALLDQLTDDVHLSQEQVREFLSVVEVYKHLLNPLEKEKTAIMIRINELLQTCECTQPPLSTELSSPSPKAAPVPRAQGGPSAAGAAGATTGGQGGPVAARAPAAAEAMVPAAAGRAVAAAAGGLDEASASASTSSATSSSMASDVCTQGPPAAVDCCSRAAAAAADCDESSMSYDSLESWSTSSSSTSSSRNNSFPLDGVNHYELLDLMSKLNSTVNKTRWLDKCCFFTCLGSLTWWQIGRLYTGFNPFPPLCGLWVRRIVARASFPLLMQVQLQPVPSGILSPLQRWRLRMEREEMQQQQQGQQELVEQELLAAAAATTPAAADVEPVSVPHAAAGGAHGGAWLMGGMLDSGPRSWGTL